MRNDDSTDDSLSLETRSKPSTPESSHEKFLGLLRKVRASFTGKSSQKVYVESESERRKSAPPVMGIEALSSKKLILRVDSNTCCDSLSKDEKITPIQERDFIISLMTYKYTCLDFQRVPLSDKLPEKNQLNEKWNRFFSAILKYHPSIFEIKPPVGITLSSEVSDQLALHKGLARIMKYSASSIPEEQNSVESEHIKSLAENVYFRLQKTWAFGDAEDADQWQGTLRKAAVSSEIQQMLDKHHEYIEDVYNTVDSLASVEDMSTEEDQSLDMSSIASTTNGVN